MKKEIIQTIKIIILGTLFSAGVSLAWTAPPTGPTGGNTLPPINQGSQNQTKNGPLGVGTLIVDGLTDFKGRVEILGTQSMPTGGGGGPQSGFLQNLFKNLPKFSFSKTAYAGHIASTAPTLSTPTIDQQTWLVQLNWVSTTGASSFKIEREDQGSGSFFPLATVSAATSYTDDLSSSGSGFGTYTYRVAASIGHQAFSAWSNEKIVTLIDPATLCQDNIATNYGGALPCIYPDTSDLYVSGKVVVGPVSSTPTEKVDVSYLGASSLMFTKPSGITQDYGRHVCANAAGKLVVCPAGHQDFYCSSSSNCNCPLNTGCAFTVPSGVYRIDFPVNCTIFGNSCNAYYTYPFVGTVGGQWTNGPKNVAPGGILPVKFNNYTNTLISISWGFQRQ